MSQDASKESVTGGRRSTYRKVTGVVDEAKWEVLNACAVAWSKGSLRGATLVVELKHAGFFGCSIMRIARPVFLLMFSNEEDRRAMLARSDLDRWFVKVEAWRPKIRITNRSVWLFVVGLPMHLWSEKSFSRIA
ncbi:hypothetical protein V6N13_092672 [Hibiscus sabdariffa]